MDRIFWSTFSVVLAMIISGANLAVAASDEAWDLVEYSGGVEIKMGLTFVTLSPNAKIDTGAVITTGANGQATLQRGKEMIVLAPNSRMTLSDEKPDGVTRILQDAGTIFFQVRKKKTKHFSVETPYLAAVVKGTRFTVDLSSNEPSVSVLDGAVEVTDFASQRVELVSTGEIMSVGRRDDQHDQSGGSGQGTKPNVESNSSSPGTSRIAPIGGAELDYNAVSNGLIRHADHSKGQNDVESALAKQSKASNSTHSGSDVSNKNSALKNAGGQVASDAIMQAYSATQGKGSARINSDGSINNGSKGSNGSNVSNGQNAQGYKVNGNGSPGLALGLEVGQGGVLPPGLGGTVPGLDNCNGIGNPNCLGDSNGNGNGNGNGN